MNYNKSHKTYKVTVSVATSEETLKFHAKILEIHSDKYCIDFIRKKGDVLEFLEHFNIIKDYLCET
jgi:hypothetical protein